MSLKLRDTAALAEVALVHYADYGRALWALDSAESMLRKARAGYRSDARTGDAAWDVEFYRVKLEDARADLERLKRLIGAEIVRHLYGEDSGCPDPRDGSCAAGSGCTMRATCKRRANERACRVIAA